MRVMIAMHLEAEAQVSQGLTIVQLWKEHGKMKRSCIRLLSLLICTTTKHSGIFGLYNIIIISYFRSCFEAKTIVQDQDLSQAAWWTATIP